MQTDYFYNEILNARMEFDVCTKSSFFRARKSFQYFQKLKIETHLRVIINRNNTDKVAL